MKAKRVFLKKIIYRLRPDRKSGLSLTGLTIIETLIGISLLALIVGGILGLLVVVQTYFKDGISLINAQAGARIVIEKMVRPARAGTGFSVSGDGNTFTLENNNGAPNTIYDFYNGDGNDATFDDNTIRKNGNSIGINIVKISGIPIFQIIPDTENKVLGINFGVKYEGIAGHYEEVHIVTEVKLRNA